ncbi:DMT family transporter [Flavobacterium sp.]|jgi:drug/metabolite transporter (DMT)-like permease|uniref:DMT family transporter n=1 Tax=Flavobacterium sp. TaxID=239 RepID=UPI0037BF5438
MPDVNLKHTLHLHLIVFIWGFTAILGKLISLDALPLVWWRMSLAVVLIFGYIYYRKTSFQLPRKDIILLIVSGLVIALHWITFFKAIKVSNISITLACLSTGAFFTSILEPIFYKRKIVWYEIVFGLIVLIGLYFVIESSEPNFIQKSITSNMSGTMRGVLLALTSAFLSANFSIINGKFAQRIDATIVSFYELLGGVLFLSVFLLFTKQFTAEFFNITLTDFMWLGILASICTAYAFIASVNVMKYISPYTVMLTINLEPVYGIALAVLIFEKKEQMSFSFYIGATIILITVILNGLIRNRKKSS